MLDAKGLTKRFANRPVLENVSLHVDRAEIVGVMGPSGEGKSTLARILCGAIPPDAGYASFEGENLVSAERPFNRRFRTAIQRIPQHPFTALDPRQTIGQAVEEPLLFHRIARSRASARERALSLFDRMLLSPSLYDRRPGEISGGQAQRVLIARALTVSPRLLIADEATSMLDLVSQAEILALLRSLNQSDGLALLIISHDPELVTSMASRVYHLSDAQLKEAYRKDFPV